MELSLLILLEVFFFLHVCFAFVCLVLMEVRTRNWELQVVGTKYRRSARAASALNR